MTLELAIFACITSCVFCAAIAVRRVMATDGVSEPAVRPLPNAVRWQGRGHGERASEKFDRWLTLSVYRSGLSITTITFVVANVCLASLVAFGLWSNGVNELYVLIAVLATLLLGWITLQVLIKRRQKKFSDQFPSALELLAQSVRAGESLEDSIELAADTCQEPVKSELGFCAQQLRIGLAVPIVMSRFAKRMPTMDVRIFTHTVSIHRETGGRLSDTLTRLAQVIRGRMDYLKKIRTMTALGRFAAIMIGYLGVIVLVYLTFMHPEYIGKLWASALGQKLATYAAVSEVVGIVWVAFTLNSND